MDLMQTHFQPSNLEPNNHIETPTKKGKKQPADEINTADSIALTDKKSSSLNDIDPQELFERFHDILKISETEQEYDYQDSDQTVYRKLDYQQNSKRAIKLDFSPSNSSMTKKNKIQNGKCLSGQLKGRQLFQLFEIESPRKARCLLQNEVKSGQTQQKLAFTPTKKNKENAHCQMTAKKQSPYRDLARKV